MPCRRFTSITNYDSNGRPLTIQDPNGLATILTYAPRGWLASRNVAGETTIYHYDYMIVYTLDNTGNRTQEDVKDPSNVFARTRSRVYSSLNRLSQDIGGANRATEITQYGYDNQGNLTTIIDPLNHVTINGYAQLNRMKPMTDPTTTGVTQYGLNALDQLVSVTDPTSPRACVGGLISARANDSSAMRRSRCVA